LTKPINSLIDAEDIQTWTDGKSSPSLVGWVGKSDNTDSKFNQNTPTKGNQVAVTPKIVDCIVNRLPVAVKGNF
jgi:hypothetical protein